MSGSSLVSPKGALYPGETCSECGEDVRIIASIEDPTVIQKILTHLDDNAASAATALLPDCRASPTVSLFD
jgi:hypothetical protein